MRALGSSNEGKHFIKICGRKMSSVFFFFFFISEMGYKLIRLE